MKNKREKKTQIESKAPFFFNYNEIKKKNSLFDSFILFSNM